MAGRQGTKTTEEEIIRDPIPTPPVFGKRGCKLLKTKETSAEKRGKSAQEAAIP